MNCKDCSILLTTNNAYSQRGKLRNRCKQCWHKYVAPATKRWRRRNRDIVAGWNRRGRNSVFFGGLRTEVLERDGYKCLTCGMTNEEHLRKWKRELSIDHIDGMGRYTPQEERNNSMENLQTLCLSCHGKKDIQRNKRERTWPN